MHHQDPTTQAAELAEQIVDEVSRAEHDWALVARWAYELFEIAARAAQVSGGERPPPGG